MYETKAFWGKESNSNINTMNTTMNFLSSSNLLPVVAAAVIALFGCMLLGTARRFG